MGVVVVILSPESLKSQVKVNTKQVHILTYLQCVSDYFCLFLVCISGVLYNNVIFDTWCFCRHGHCVVMEL